MRASHRLVRVIFAMGKPQRPDELAGYVAQVGVAGVDGFIVAKATLYMG